MLKKAGIVVATATAGLLAVSPLAFADGLIAIDDNAIQIPVQLCNNSIVNNVIVGVLSSRERNRSENKGKCKQRNSADIDHKRRHHRDHD